MKEISEQTKDKSGWPAGPWQSEPDKMQFPDPETKLPCLVVRGPFGALCGYVGIPPSHPLHGRSYSDVVKVSDEVLNRGIAVDRMAIIPMVCQDPDNLKENKIGS